jgi:shikimate dehydrogenase
MKRACVIGWPIKHSRSPIIHNYWLKRHGISGRYEKCEVAPDQLQAFIKGIGTDFIGCNITVPHKGAALGMLDDIDETARAVGAVNTVWAESGKVRGMNTDVAGFLSSLDQEAPGWDKTLNAVVIGAGGAARAVVYGLKSRGAKSITIVNRSTAHAENLAKDLGAGTVAGFDDLPEKLGVATLLVNATTIGMEGGPRLTISLEGLPKSAVVADLVYTPLRTSLLKQAATRGNRTVAGLGMLLHQAVFGFEKWFGVRPEVTPDLRKLVEADISGAAQ